jgi:hypothetical protein
VPPLRIIAPHASFARVSRVNRRPRGVGPAANDLPESSYRNRALRPGGGAGPRNGGRGDGPAPRALGPAQELAIPTTGATSGVPPIEPEKAASP